MTDSNGTETIEVDSIDLTDLSRFAHGFPYETFEVLRREAPVWFHHPTEHTPDDEGFWVVSKHSDCVAVAADSSTFSSHTGPGRDGAGGTLIEDLPGGFAAGVLLNMIDDPHHSDIRRTLTPSLSKRALNQLEDDLHARTTHIVDAVAAAGTCDLVSDVAVELPLQAIAHLLGVPQQDRHNLFGWATATLDYQDRELGEATSRMAEASAAMFAYGTELVESKRINGPAHAFDMLAAAVASKEPQLTELELQMLFNLLVAAGSETTRNSITLGLLALAAEPLQWQRLQQDRSLVPAAVEEVLRFASTTPYNRRTATVDIELGGQWIKAGEKVTLWWASANRDEDVFADANRFIVDRTPNPHLAFGHGTHFCLGSNLARSEIRLILEAFLDRFDGLELTEPLRWTRSNKHTGVSRAAVRLFPRQSLNS
ncbi:MAG: cytochrome P450 [Microthrixaceae bacterium]|nr:cytochrome P450 [Microthrixaceae bacterium]